MKPENSLILFVICMLGLSSVAVGKHRSSGSHHRSSRSHHHSSSLYRNYRPVLSFFGGAARMNPSRSQTYLGTDNNLFSYESQNENNTTGLVGAFLGVEHPLPHSHFLTQTGIQYTQYASTNVNAPHIVGIDPNTSTLHNYRYNFRGRQLLLVAKFLTTVNKKYHPYISVGVGASFNTMGHFNTSTTETGSINLAPTFNSNTHRAFSYSLGLGMDTTVSKHVRIGLGYQFTDLGSASLANGGVVFNNYTSPVPFIPRLSHVYVNQLIA